MTGLYPSPRNTTTANSTLPRKTIPRIGSQYQRPVMDGNGRRGRGSYHDVHVEPVGAEAEHALGLRGEIGEVRWEHRRCYLRRRHDRSLPAGSLPPTISWWRSMVVVGVGLGWGEGAHWGKTISSGRRLPGGFVHAHACADRRVWGVGGPRVIHAVLYFAGSAQ